MNPVEDVQDAAASRPGPRPQARDEHEEDSTLLMDATMKGDMPPFALPEAGIHGAREKDLGASSVCRALRPQPPWYGYSLGDWLPQWDEAARRAAEGDYLENGRISEKQRRKGSSPKRSSGPGRASRTDWRFAFIG